MGWLGRIWRRLVLRPQPTINVEFRVLAGDAYWRWRDREAIAKLRRAGEAFAAAVISALEEDG